MLLELENRILNHFFTDELSLKKNRNSFDLIPDLSNNYWKVNYSVIEDKRKTKDILGYSCYQMIIIESKTHIKNLEKKKIQYKMWVTSKIQLPADIVLRFWKPVTNLCPLEILVCDPIKQHVSFLQKVIEIDKEAVFDEKDIPLNYQEILYAN